ncbi:hypothetical protein [Limosilactobacillus reuteri]|uniref:hypothetical protein n=1 Tax=Limosilactobacillus reuteri TaxID=1598 RepID=UPI002B05DBDD|nr:hypothetical protein [Limosilactobacillus reuteri]
MKMRETAPKEERETIISYDAMTGNWHFYSNEPKHIRRWSKHIKHIDQQAQNQYGYITVLEGDLDNTSVSLRQIRQLTPEQKEAIGKRLHSYKEKDN